MANLDLRYTQRVCRNFTSDRSRKPWRVVVYWNGKRQFLGYFPTQEEAERRECLEYDRYIAEEFYAD